MKWSNAIFLLVLVVLLSVLSTQATSNKKKEAQLTKHKNEKIHKSSLLGQKEMISKGAKSHGDHHAVKEVQKHAPLSVSSHEASIQSDLSHGKGKSQHNGPKGDIKLQDLLIEDALHHKRQSHKTHSNHDNHSSSNLQSSGHAQKMHVPSGGGGHKMMPFKSQNSHASNGGRVDKYDKSVKASKKGLPSKYKKNKRIKRLHKQFIF